jgi:hypothetical protein
MLAYENCKNRPVLAWHAIVPPRASVAREVFLYTEKIPFFSKFLTRCFNMFFICTKQVRRVWGCETRLIKKIVLK